MHPCVTYGALMCFMQVHVYVTYILYYVIVSFCYCYIQVCLYVYYMSIIYKIYVMLCLFSVYHMSIVYNRMFMQVHVYINMFYYIIIYMYDVMSFCFCWIRNTLESNCAEHGGAESVETIGP